MCWKAPSTLSEDRLAFDMHQAATRFTATPASAVTSTRVPPTSGGSKRRSILSYVSQAESSGRVSPLDWAERTSARFRP